MKWLNAGKQRSKKANKLARGEDAYSVLKMIMDDLVILEIFTIFRDREQSTIMMLDNKR